MSPIDTLRECLTLFKKISDKSVTPMQAYHGACDMEGKLDAAIKQIEQAYLGLSIEMQIQAERGKRADDYLDKMGISNGWGSQHPHSIEDRLDVLAHKRYNAGAHEANERNLKNSQDHHAHAYLTKLGVMSARVVRKTDDDKDVWAPIPVEERIDLLVRKVKDATRAEERKKRSSADIAITSANKYLDMLGVPRYAEGRIQNQLSLADRIEHLYDETRKSAEFELKELHGYLDHKDVPPGKAVRRVDDYITRRAMEIQRRLTGRLVDLDTLEAALDEKDIPVGKVIDRVTNHVAVEVEKARQSAGLASVDIQNINKYLDSLGSPVYRTTYERVANFVDRVRNVGKRVESIDTSATAQMDALNQWLDDRDVPKEESIIYRVQIYVKTREAWGKQFIKDRITDTMSCYVK